jgi:hypothetical protein
MSASLKCFVHRLHHALLHGILRIEDAGRIAEHDLVVLVRSSSPRIRWRVVWALGFTITRSSPNKRIEQGALARVRLADDVDVSCLVCHGMVVQH